MPKSQRMQYAQSIKSLDLNKIVRQDDGSIVLNAGAFKVGNYEHLGFEVPLPGINYNDIIIGRLEEKTAVDMLPQFEGLPLTRGHVWIENLQDRKQYSVGSVIANAVLENDIAMTRIVITDADTIAKIEAKKYNELSIGFDYLVRDVRGQMEGVDFLIEDVKLNHLALVEEGRAGVQARLYNHAKSKELNMAKVTIGGVDYDVPEEVANHISNIDQKLSGSQSEFKKVNDANSRLQAQFDAVKKEQDKNTVQTKAVELATAHAEFSKRMDAMGVKFEKPLGQYDAISEMKSALTAKGHEFKADAEDVYIEALFDIVSKQTEPSSKLAEMQFEKTVVTTGVGQYAAAAEDIDASNAASKGYFFGKGESK